MQNPAHLSGTPVDPAAITSAGTVSVEILVDED